MQYPTTTVTLTPREIDLIITALHESAEDREQFDEPEQSAAFAVLQRRFVKAQNQVITH
jgi:hypothetical protein